MLKATSATGWACTMPRRSGRTLYIPRWNGSSDEGLWLPEMVPSARTATMSSRLSAPLSTRAGVIQTVPSSSRMERFPPDVVVIR